MIGSLAQSRSITTLDGRPLGTGLITEVTDCVFMFIPVGVIQRGLGFSWWTLLPLLWCRVAHGWSDTNHTLIGAIKINPKCYAHRCPGWSFGQDHPFGDQNAPSEEEESLAWDSLYDWEAPVDDTFPREGSDSDLNVESLTGSQADAEDWGL